ncbi:RCC1 and BTB domain-containing protein 2-like isoform X2 [Planococcus citri]|uniref:RCC1 and BTB domain-containing protein 2-like isoform X2 n=1 Tax=Planococcus citri TaxID=170843 RepID=UPI0031F83AEE
MESISTSIRVPFFSLIEKNFIKEIKRLFFSGPKMIIITKSDEVYGLGPLPDSETYPDDLQLRQIPQLNGIKIKKILFGKNFVIVLTSKGTVFSWGENEKGQLGVGYINEISTPIVISTLASKKVIDVACGSTHAIARCSDNQIYFWGKGISVHPGYSEPNTIAITSTDEGVFYVTTKGEVYGMGYVCSKTYHSPTYSLGNGYTNAPVTIWTQIDNLSNIKKIVGGKHHIMALNNDGYVFVWGDNGKGQLGFCIPTNQPTPVKFSGISEKIIDIAANSQSDLSAAITQSSKLYVWGAYPGGYFSKPYLTSFTSFNEAFTNFSDPNMTYECVTFEALEEESDDQDNH